MSKKPVYILAAILAFVGVALYVYKVVFLGYPVVPDAKIDVWEVEVRAEFTATGGPVRFSLYTPSSTGRMTVLARRFVAPGFGLTSEQVEPNQRAVIATRGAAGQQTIYYRLTLQLNSTGPRIPPSLKPTVAEHGLDSAQLKAAQTIANDAEARSADRATMVPLIIKSFTEEPRGNAASVVLGARPERRDVALGIARTLRVAGVPAHIVNGLALENERRHAQLTHWVEVYVGDKWVAYDLSSGTQGVPDSHLVWWRGDGQLTSLTGGTDLTLNIATSRIEESALANLLATARSRRDDLIGFSLYALPIQTQHVYRLLVVVPIGIFLLVLLRNVVGISTLGTFMPVLIALAFRETQLLWGVILFVTVVGSGLLIRAYFETLKLLLVPRLAAVLICVVLIMAGFSILSHRLGLDQGLSVALFPMVIMTMTIERLSIIWDERGATHALKQAVGSLIVATLCYLLMNISLLAHQLFTFPELLLIVLAATILLGRYSGYRLVELPRFRVLLQGRERA